MKERRDTRSEGVRERETEQPRAKEEKMNDVIKKKPVGGLRAMGEVEMKDNKEMNKYTNRLRNHLIPTNHMTNPSSLITGSTLNSYLAMSG